MDHQQQQIKDCIKSCQDVMKKMQPMAQGINEKMLKSTIDESVHHLEMCMYECEWAADQTP